MSRSSPIKCERRDVSPPRGTSPGRDRNHELNRLSKAADQRADQIARLANKAEMLSHQVNNMRQSSGNVSTPKHPRTNFPRGMRVAAASELTVRAIQAVAVGDLGTVHGPSDDPYLVGGVNVLWDRRRDGGTRRINVLPDDIKPVYDPLSPTQMQAGRPYSTSPAKPAYPSYLSPSKYSPTTNASMDSNPFNSGSYQYRPAVQVPSPSRSPMQNRPVSPSHHVAPVSPPVGVGSPTDNHMQFRQLSQAGLMPSPGTAGQPPSPAAQDEPVRWHEGGAAEEPRDAEDERKKLQQLHEEVDRQRHELQQLERQREEVKQAEAAEQARLDQLREEAQRLQTTGQAVDGTAEQARVDALRTEAAQLEGSTSEERAKLECLRAELQQLEADRQQHDALREEARRIKDETQQLRDQREALMRQQQQQEAEEVRKLQSLREEIQGMESQAAAAETVRAELQAITEERDRIQQLREEARKQRAEEEEFEAQRLQQLRDDIRKIEEEKQNERARVEELRDSLRRSREQEEADEGTKLRKLRDELRRVEDEKRTAEVRRDEETRKSEEERVQLEILRDEARRQREKVQEEMATLDRLRAEQQTTAAASAQQAALSTEATSEQAKVDELRETHRRLEADIMALQTHKEAAAATVIGDIRHLEIQRDRVAEEKAELAKEKEHAEVEWALEKQRAKQDAAEQLQQAVLVQEEAMKRELDERKAALDKAVAAEEQRLALLTQQVQDEEARLAQQQLSNGHVAAPPTPETTPTGVPAATIAEIEELNARLATATAALQEEERKLAEAAIRRDAIEKEAQAAEAACHQAVARRQAEEERLAGLQAQVRDAEDKLATRALMGQHHSDFGELGASTSGHAVHDDPFGVAVCEEDVPRAVTDEMIRAQSINEIAPHMGDTLRNPQSAASGVSGSGVSMSGGELRSTPSGVWMSKGRASIRISKTSVMSKSQLSRAGSLGKILVELAEERASGVPSYDGEDYEGEIPDEAIWWQVPEVDVETVTFVHPSCDVPPDGTTAPRAGAIVTFDTMGNPPQLRLRIDAEKQPLISAIAMERNENGVFLLFPGDAHQAAVNDRTVCLPVENMNEVVAGILCLSKRCNVAQHLNYEYEALANQEAIIEQYLNRGGTVPWPFVNKLLSPDYLVGPASSAATAAALAVVMALAPQQSRCSIM
eukprot:TRINITY_DN27187_c0_g1_i1.p1 TRINITY_DN27187_c0_g1~~TRINITY_DN27187_c0_g1_i1.p1  ORF type:complete len:1173 (+),score=481.09 TRINITY_DN27187_c0_g1_i1:73-3591(+)